MLRKKTKFRIIRKFKYVFYGLGIHRILPIYILNFLGHLSATSKWITQHRNLSFTDFPNSSFDSSRRILLHEYVIEHEIQESPIDYFEFGVATGVSFRWWVNRIGHSNSQFYGFDTFSGLPEDWGPFKAGAMSNGNKPPEIDDSRHSFYQGIFQQTLPDFLKKYESSRRKVIHMDADLYSSTLFVLTSMSPFLRSGDVILFDEFNVPLHEFKAFDEWIKSYYIEYEVIGEVNNYYQIALKIK